MNKLRKVDLVMWTKNSAKTLPLVLKRIDEVIPYEFVGKRIIVDDHSEDKTAEVAKDFGWMVYKNRGRGFGDAVATALSHVTADFFVSVEHDVILARDWWEKIWKYTKDESIAATQGVRVATNPILRKLDEYIIERKDARADLLSVDNNIYRTAIFRELSWHGDHGNATKRKLEQKGMKWIVDKSVISDHIRPGVLPYLRHVYKMALIMKVEANRLSMFIMFLLSPLRALHVVFRKKCPQILIVYPLIRLSILKASLEKGKR